MIVIMAMSYTSIKSIVNDKINNNMKIDNEKASISEKIESISAVTQQVSAASEERAASSEEMDDSAQCVAKTADKLNDMTKEMKEQMNKFQI